MYVRQVKFVDLKRSKWNKSKSDPSKGHYVFEPDGKKYVDYVDAQPGHKLTWCRYDPTHPAGGKDVLDWKTKWNYDYVRASEGLYWPEGVPPNAEGIYQFHHGDLVLMQCPAVDYAERKKAEIMRSENAAQNAVKSFESGARNAGIGVDRQQLSDVLRRA